MSENLKPCPFCGKESPSLKFNSECDWWYLQCDKCYASIGIHDDNVSVSDNAQYEIDEYDDAMEFVESGDIKGIEPLFEKWNRRSK